MKQSFFSAYITVLLLFLVGQPLLARQKFQELSTNHFRFEYGIDHHEVAKRLLDTAEDIRKRHCQLISPCYDGVITVQIASSEKEFLGLQPSQAHIDWAAGVAYGHLSLIILRIDKDMLLSLGETFEHEVSHVLLLQAVKKRPPRWFIEGMAIIQARQDLIERFTRVSAATIADNLYPLEQISVSFPGSTSGRSLAYAQSGLFLAYLRSEYGDTKLRKMVTELHNTDNFKRAFRQVFESPLEDVEKNWHSSLGSGAWLLAITESWVLWSAMSILFLVALVVRRYRNRLRKRAMEDEERDWEYREPLS
jgi:hypothetical protein